MKNFAIGTISNDRRLLLKVVDSCWISSTKWSDTFRSFFGIWKGARILKKYIITVQNNSPS